MKKWSFEDGWNRGKKGRPYTEKSKAILADCIKEIEPFSGRITIRQLFYRMVSLGHYESTAKNFYGQLLDSNSLNS